MWVIDTKGIARNLALAHRIETGEYHGQIIVYATFALKGEKNSNDSAFYEMATLAIFDSSENAKTYLKELVEKLNHAEDLLNIISGVLDARM